MKKFRFRYESILTLRKKEEDAIKNDLAAILSKRQHVIEARQEMYNRQATYQTHIQETMKRGCSADALKSIEQGQVYYRKHIKSLNEDIDRLDHEVLKTQALLVEAVKARKIMEKVKENDFTAFKEAFEKEENKVIEEIVNYKNNKNGEGING